MFRALHRRLKLIRYYSARRSQSAWSHGLGWALIGSFFLGPVAVPIVEVLTPRQQLTEQLEASVVKREDGSFFSVIMRDEKERAAWAGGSPYGQISLRQHARMSGFPFVTHVALQAPEVDLLRFSEGVLRKNVALERQKPLREAIEQALIEAGEEPMLTSWRMREQPPTRRLWISSAAGAAVWWVTFSFLSWISIVTARFVILLMHDRRQKRELRRYAAGLCATCGYNLRGLEFQARCPECGTLVE